MTTDYMNPFDDYDISDSEPDEGITCRVCGKAGLSLINTGLHWRLFEDGGHAHLCDFKKPNPDDFAPV